MFPEKTVPYLFNFTFFKWIFYSTLSWENEPSVFRMVQPLGTRTVLNMRVLSPFLLHNGTGALSYLLKREMGSGNVKFEGLWCFLFFLFSFFRTHFSLFSSYNRNFCVSCGFTITGSSRALRKPALTTGKICIWVSVHKAAKGNNDSIVILRYFQLAHAASVLCVRMGRAVPAPSTVAPQGIQEEPWQILCLNNILTSWGEG